MKAEKSRLARPRGLGKLLRIRLGRWLDRHQPPETVVLMGTALLVGLGAGLGAVVFRWLIDLVHKLSFEDLGQALPFLGDYVLVLAPALGGLIVGPLIYFFAREAKGHGVPEVMEAVALRGGRIRPIVVVIKSLASSISIGSGGSVGREGPIVQIGSALGSTLGQALHMSDERIRNLVACGAAGGIAATFNAPIAGVIFALEVILGEFSVRYFSTVVISSVTASVVGRIALGDVPAFVIQPYQLVSPWELVFYTLMGVLAAFVAVAFTRILYLFEDAFDAWKRFPEYLKTPVGGLLLGLGGLLFVRSNQSLGMGVPGDPVAFFGVGYDAMEWALLGQGTVLLLLGLVVIKILATSLTIGSGGSGGVFAPSLFIGVDAGRGVWPRGPQPLSGGDGPAGRLRPGGHGRPLFRGRPRTHHGHPHPVRDDRRLSHHPAPDAGHGHQHRPGRVSEQGESSTRSSSRGVGCGWSGAATSTSCRACWWARP